VGAEKDLSANRLHHPKAADDARGRHRRRCDEQNQPGMIERAIGQE
jgi:hypothetical protein